MVDKQNGIELAISEKCSLTGEKAGADRDDVTVVRASWGRKAEFLLALIGLSVGLGNVWRFPYVCMRNGGGAFLIPFFLCLMVCLFPLYFLEVALGQWLAKSSFHVYSFCPLLKGIGVSLNVMALVLVWFYPMVLVWSLIYLVHSFRSPLPWTQCGQWYNSPDCVAITGSDSPNRNTTDGLFDDNANITKSNTTSSASEEFWLHNVLEVSDGFADMGGLPWHTCLALLVATLIILFAVIKGVKSVGKVVWVTATLPYLLITILLVRGATLPGAYNGVLFYVTPNFHKLLELNTWLEASLQVFYSLGPCWGGIQTMASYNKFTNNCLKDSIILSLLCEGTSVFAGFAIFTILGHMSETLGIPIESFSKSGPGLAFVVYPEAISYLPFSQFWAVLFFFMLITVGLDSCIVQAEIPLTTIADLWPGLLRGRDYIVKVVFLGFFMILSLVFCTRGGLYYFTLADWYFAAITPIVVGILEAAGITWIYGAERFRNDIAMMLGHKPPYIFTILWKYVIPFLLSVMCFAVLYGYQSPTPNGYNYSPAEQAFGWAIGIVSFIPMPAWVVWKLVCTEGSLLDRLRYTCRPSPDWKPQVPELQEQYTKDTGMVYTYTATQPSFRVV